MRGSTRILTGLFLSLTTSLAAAVPLTWTLDNVVFDDGSTATGSFVYDAATNTYSNVALATSASGPVPPATYVFGSNPNNTTVSSRYSTTAFGFMGANLAGVPIDVYDEFDQLLFTTYFYPQLLLRFTSALTDAGGLVPLVAGTQSLPIDNISTLFGSVGFACFGGPSFAGCVAASSGELVPQFTRLVVSGNVTATPVPVPAAAMSLSAALALLGFVRRRAA